MKGKSLIVGIALLSYLWLPLSAVFAQGSTKAAALQKVYEAAKKEGELVAHDGGRADQFAKVVEVFKQRFPGIVVKPIVVTIPSILPQIIAEAGAGKLSIDVARATPKYLSDLIARDLVKKIDLSDVMDIDPKLVLMEGRLFMDSSRVYCIAYNTKLVSPADVPKTWEDLLDPKWKGGRISMCRQGEMETALFFEREQSQVVNFLKQYREQKPLVVESPRASADTIASGQVALGETMSSTVWDLVNKGAPLAISPVSPQLFLANGNYVVKGPHPNAAKLWTAWRMSAEGREALFKFTGDASEDRPENCPSAKMLHEARVRYIIIDSMEKATVQSKYQVTTVELLGLRK